MSRRLVAGLSLALLALIVPAYSTSTKTEAAEPASLGELAKQSLARLDGEVKVAGLKAPVEIVRDQQGIPHIYAKNDDDMFFAQGYVMAQDRLWQLEMWRRWREGRLAEIFGPKAYRLRRAYAAADVPRAVGRQGVEELPPRRRAPLHRVGQRPQRVRGTERRQPSGGVQAHRHQARAVDRENGDAALGGTWSRQRRRHAARRDPPCARALPEAGRGGSEQARCAGPMGRPGRARGTRREHHHG